MGGGSCNCNKGSNIGPQTFNVPLVAKALSAKPVNSFKLEPVKPIQSFTPRPTRDAIMKKK